MDGILPAAGAASRMRGIPKFLLPCTTSYKTLLERHLEEMLKYCDIVWIPTRPELVNLLQSLGLSSDRVVIMSVSTKTMTETVMHVVNVASAGEFMLCMPDTFFSQDLPYERLQNLEGDVMFACWKIRQDQKGKLGQVLFDDTPQEATPIKHSIDKDSNCDYPHAWGALSFNRRFIQLGNPDMSHVGYIINPAIKAGLQVNGFSLSGDYYDCGTPKEYVQLLKEFDHE